jgi:hypothetical protein
MGFSLVVIPQDRRVARRRGMNYVYRPSSKSLPGRVGMVLKDTARARVPRTRDDTVSRR